MLRIRHVGLWSTYMHTRIGVSMCLKAFTTTPSVLEFGWIQVFNAKGTLSASATLDGEVERIEQVENQFKQLTSTAFKSSARTTRICISAQRYDWHMGHYNFWKYFTCMGALQLSKWPHRDTSQQLNSTQLKIYLRL